MSLFIRVSGSTFTAHRGTARVNNDSQRRKVQLTGCANYVGALTTLGVPAGAKKADRKAARRTRLHAPPDAAFSQFRAAVQALP
jgi:hypothetical protein